MSLFSQLAATFAPKIDTGDPLLTSVIQWCAKVQHHAGLRWRLVASSGVRCGLEEMESAYALRACTRLAVEPCLLCGGAVCLEHAAVTVQGTVACLRCLTVYQEVVRARVREQGDRPPPPPPGTPPPGKPGPTPAELRVKHLATLGLKDPADWAEINGAFRALGKKLHPDHVAPTQKAASAKRLMKITEAHAWLKKQEGP